MFKDALGNVTKAVDQTYDVFNRWIKRSVDSDGPGAGAAADTFFSYQDGQVVLQFEGNTLTNRYLWGPAVDMLLADEQVTTGKVIYPLGDHLNTNRDLAEYDGTTTIANHRQYDSFGNVISETNAAVDELFGFTGRMLDESTGLQNNWNRWYDAEVGQWISEDPIGFAAGDANLSRYAFNSPLSLTDPSGLFPPIINPALIFGANPGDPKWGPLSGQLAGMAEEHRNNPLVVFPAGIGAVFISLFDAVPCAVNESAGNSRKIIAEDISSTNDPVRKAIGSVAYGYTWIGQGFALFGAAEGAGAPITAGVGLAFPPPPLSAPPVNPVPATFARVIPGHLNPTRLGVTPNIFVTNANALKGVTPTQIAQVLEIPVSPSFKIIEFSSEGVCGIATPIRSASPGFVGRGVTSGGAPEFLIPNGPIPGGAVIRIVE